MKHPAVSERQNEAAADRSSNAFTPDNLEAAWALLQNGVKVVVSVPKEAVNAELDAEQKQRIKARKVKEGKK